MGRAAIVATRRSFLALCLVAAGVSGANRALAQTQPAAPTSTASSASLQEVTVIGTRIRGTDASSANPITVATAADIDQTSALTIEQFVPNLPVLDFTGGATAGDNDVGLGANFVGLRNLGPQRTLVLVNGQRFPLTDNQGSFDAVDMNNIPLSMVDSITVLRDGASSIYGADAIAGVINIVTKQHFNGVQIDGTAGESSYGDAGRYGISFTMGSDFDRGNILVNLSYDHQSPVLGAARPWAVSQHEDAGYNSYPQISSNVVGAKGLIGGNLWFFPSGLNSGMLDSNITSGPLPPGDIAVPFGGAFFNYGPGTMLINGLERRQVNLTGTYNLTHNVDLLLEGFYTYRQSSGQANPTQTGASTTTPTFPNGFYSPGFLPSGACNPMNPTCGATAAQQAAINTLYGITGPEDVPIFTRRTETGDRIYISDTNTYRIRAALKGTLFSNYDWEAGYLYGQSSATYTEYNDTNFLHMAQELGMEPCGPEAGCSLANFFGYNTLTPAQAEYLSYTNINTSVYTMQMEYANLDGPLFNVPAGTVKAAIGAEHRSEDLQEIPSPIVSAGDALTYTLPTAGSYATTSVYAEVNAPLVKEVPGMKMVTLNLSGRYDDNSTFGSDSTYKLGLNWAVIDDLRLRANYSTGFRAPQLKELYAGDFLIQPGGFDPCAPGGAYFGNAACEAAIKAAGGSSSTVQQINQINVITGGNSALKPETSRQANAGVVITPRAIPNFEVTADYYHIEINNEIGTLDANNVLAACYGGVPYVITQAEACKLVGPRLQGTGDLGNVTLLNENLFSELAEGWDFHIGYAFDTARIGLPAWGRFSISGDGTYLIRDDITGAGVTVKQAGTFITDYGWTRFKGILNFDFASKYNWTAHWAMRYYGALRNQDPTSACQYGSVPCGPNPFDFIGNSTGGVTYNDVSASYRYQGLLVSLGVDNLFNKQPPFLTPNQDLNTMGAAGYDLIGRFLYLKLSAKL